MKTLNTAILNLMPTKAVTARQLRSLLSSGGARHNITWLTTASYKSKSAQTPGVKEVYTTFDKVRHKNFDLFIITGAPVEDMAFEDVAYWRELTDILDAAKKTALFNIYICWAAQAALYHFYGVAKKPLAQKYFGVYKQKLKNPRSVFFDGIGDGCLMPHSRHTTVEGYEGKPALIVEASTKDGGPSVLSGADLKSLYITGHCEYDAQTLHLEYQRDLREGKPILPPKNCDGQTIPWRADAERFYKNITKHILGLKKG